MTKSVSPQDAIKAALEQNWQEAVRLNTLLLETNQDNVDSLNRLGFAYLMQGELTKAKNTFQKVIKLDPYNQISQKNLSKLSVIKQKNTEPKTNNNTQISPLSFLEEPGKTKIVECVHLAPIQVLSLFSPGQEVMLLPKNHVVEIRTPTNVYLGALPDDLSFRLLKLIAGGNRYQAFIKSLNKKSVLILIRETLRGKRFANHPSFGVTIGYLPVGPVASSSSGGGEEIEEKDTD